MHIHLDLWDTDISIFLSPKHLEDVFKTCLQDIFKTCLFETCLQDVFSVTIFRLPRRLHDVFARSLARRKIVTLKMCWRRLQDMSRRRLQDVFKTNKCLLGYSCKFIMVEGPFSFLFYCKRGINQYAAQKTLADVFGASLLLLELGCLRYVVLSHHLRMFLRVFMRR